MAGSLHAQVADTALGGRLVVSKTFAAPFNDSLVLTLRRHGEYRVAIWPGAARMRVVAADRKADTAFTPRTREGVGAHATRVEIYVNHDGPQVMTVRAPAGVDQVTVWVWEDSAAEVVASERSSRRWRLGLRAAAGQASAYMIGDPVPAHPATFGEGAATVSSTASPLRFALGFTRDPRSAGVVAVSWFFVETAVRIARLEAAGRQLDLAVTGRVAQGSVEFGHISDPTMLAAGLSLDWHLDRQQGARGWTIGAQAMYGRLGNLGSDYPSIERAEVTLGWTP